MTRISEELGSVADEYLVQCLYDLCESCIATDGTTIEVPFDLAPVCLQLAKVGEARHLSGRFTGRPLFSKGAGTAALQVSILQYPNASKALLEWRRLFGRELTDREILADLMERIAGAQLAGRDYLLMSLLNGQLLLLLAKAGISRPKGRQRRSRDEKLLLMTVISLASAGKQRRLEDAAKDGRKLKAIDAELEAVEEARHYRGRPLFSAEYIRRRMHDRAYTSGRA